MSWLVGLVVGWFLMRWVQSMMEKDEPNEQPVPMPTHLNYAFDARRNWALSLAHPMAAARIRSGFASPQEAWPRDELQQTVRPALLHLFGLRTDLADAQIQLNLNDKLNKRWFCIDMDALRPEDDPRDALAFACARVAFATRVAGAMGWIDDTTQWSVLLQNAQRANDCFTDWRDFGTAWARGRKQWVAGSRADSLGVSLDAAKVEQWLNEPQHPWCALPWRVPPLFVPPTPPFSQTPLNPLATPAAV
jgi:hypothetical protein